MVVLRPNTSSVDASFCSLAILSRSVRRFQGFSAINCLPKLIGFGFRSFPPSSLITHFFRAPFGWGSSLGHVPSYSFLITEPPGSRSVPWNDTVLGSFDLNPRRLRREV